MTAVFTDIGADAVKIGMLYSAELIEAVTATLNNQHARNIVLDPVMVAQSGDKLLQDDAIRAGAAYKIGHGHGPVHHFFEFWE
jgi:hydroxymethylpyrimidine/phosphomethylpyrimidine kinase